MNRVETPRAKVYPRKRPWYSRVISRKVALRIGYCNMAFATFANFVYLLILLEACNQDLLKLDVNPGNGTPYPEPQVIHKAYAKAFYVGVVVGCYIYWAWKGWRLILLTNTGTDSEDCWEFSPVWKPYLVLFLASIVLAIATKEHVEILASLLLYLSFTIYINAWCIHGLEEKKELAFVDGNIVYFKHDNDNDNESIVLYINKYFLLYIRKGSFLYIKGNFVLHMKEDALVYFV